MPYVEPSFPFGNLRGAGTKFHVSQVISNAYNKFKKTHHKYCGIFVLIKPVAILLDPDLIENVLVKDCASFSDQGNHSNALGK